MPAPKTVTNVTYLPNLKKAKRKGNRNHEMVECPNLDQLCSTLGWKMAAQALGMSEGALRINVKDNAAKRTVELAATHLLGLLRQQQQALIRSRTAPKQKLPKQVFSFTMPEDEAAQSLIRMVLKNAEVDPTVHEVKVD